MIAVREQVKMGLLVCPQTKTRLTWDGAGLMSEAGRKYRITEHGTPILLSNPDSAEQYAASSPQMLKEYSNGHFWCWDKIVPSLRSWIRKDYRTHASQRAVDEVLKCGQGDRMCLSIGGGPMRVSPDVTNLNIGNFRNVDVIGDALLLPYADSSVDSIYCEAVLEHLTDPTVAVSEMFRVLKPEGKVVAITPFLQRFHGYPSHFQNFTLFGHSLLFSRAGFRLLESGTCGGPTYTIVNLVSAYFLRCLPRVVGLPLAAAWNIAGIAILPLDRLIGPTDVSHLLASTTYVLAEKPTATS
jgi:SAM-dependent methyltransferase/uncharacterized protein YbaR (Trm112 family)